MSRRTVSEREAARLLHNLLTQKAPRKPQAPREADTLPETTEHQIQAALVARIAAHATQRPALRLLYAVPNGARTAMAVAVRLKAEGMQRGVPDLVLPVARGGFHGLYCEMKRPGGKVSKEQRAWLDALAAEGYYATVCYGADIAERIILDYEAGAYTR